MDGMRPEAPHGDEDIRMFSEDEETMPLLELVSGTDEDLSSQSDESSEEDSDSELDIDVGTGSGLYTSAAVFSQATSTFERPSATTTSQMQTWSPPSSLATTTVDQPATSQQRARQPQSRQPRPGTAENVEANDIEDLFFPQPTDADDTVVLSDLLRTGEASRLRRRGAVAVREREHHNVPVVQTRFNTPPHSFHTNSFGDSTSATWRAPGLVDRRPNQYEEYNFILFCGNVHSATSSSKGKEKAHGTQEWGCGALIHTHVSPRPTPRSTLSDPQSELPRRRPYGPDPGQSRGSGQEAEGTDGRAARGVWTARTECVEGAVARLEDHYFAMAEHDDEAETLGLTPSQRSARRTEREVRVDMQNARQRFTGTTTGWRSGINDCGCIREGIGCAVCGNPLGTRYIPCKAAAQSYIRPRIERSQYLAQLRAGEVDKRIDAPEGSAYWGSSVGEHRPEPFPPRSFLTSSSSASSIRDPSASTSTHRSTTSTAREEGERLVIYTFFSDPVTSSNPVYDFDLVQPMPTPAVAAPPPQITTTVSDAPSFLASAPSRIIAAPPPRDSLLDRLRQGPNYLRGESNILLAPETVLGMMPLSPTPPSGPSPPSDNPGDTRGVERATFRREDYRLTERSRVWSDAAMFRLPFDGTEPANLTDEDEDDFVVAGGPHSAPSRPRRRRRAIVLLRGQRRGFDPDGGEISSVSESDGEDGNDDFITFADPAYTNPTRMSRRSVFIDSDSSDSDDDQGMHTHAPAALNNIAHENTNETDGTVGDLFRPSLAGGGYDAESSLTIRGQQVLAREVESRALAPGESLPSLHEYMHMALAAQRGRGAGGLLRPSRSLDQILGTELGTEQAEEHLAQLRIQLANVRAMNTRLAEIGRVWTGERIEGQNGDGVGGGLESIIGAAAAAAGGEGILSMGDPGVQATHEERQRALRRTQDFLQNNNAEESLTSISRMMQSVVTDIEASGNGAFITPGMRNAVATATSHANSVSNSLGTMRELTGMNGQILDITNRLAARRAQGGGAGGIRGENGDDRWEQQRDETRRQFDSMNQQLDEIRVQLLEGRSGGDDSPARVSHVDSLRGIRSRLNDMLGLLSDRRGSAEAGGAGGVGAGGEERGNGPPETSRDQTTPSGGPAISTPTSATSENSTASSTSDPGLDTIPALPTRSATALGHHVILDLNRIIPSLSDTPYLVSGSRAQVEVPNDGGVRGAVNEITGITRETVDDRITRETLEDMDVDMVIGEVGRSVGESALPLVRAPSRRDAIQSSLDPNSMDVDEGDVNATSAFGPIVESPEPLAPPIPLSVLTGTNTVNTGPFNTFDVSTAPSYGLFPDPREGWVGTTPSTRPTSSVSYIQESMERQEQLWLQSVRQQAPSGAVANAEAVTGQGRASATVARERERRENANLRAIASVRAAWRTRVGLLDPDGERFVYDERYGVDGDEVEPGIDLDGVRYERTEGSQEKEQQRLRDVWESIVFRDR